MGKNKKRSRMQKVWLIITIIAVLAMVAFSIAPMLVYY